MQITALQPLGQGTVFCNLWRRLWIDPFSALAWIHLGGGGAAGS
jgi:hypothetical protein